jgi:putative polyhydroxyalkanoate system protein
MSDIKVVRRHSLPMAHARALAERAVDELAARYGVAAEWQGDVLRFSARSAEGRVHLSPSEIRIDVKLGRVLSLFKKRLTERIENHLDRLLARRAAPRSRKR